MGDEGERGHQGPTVGPSAEALALQGLAWVLLGWRPLDLALRGPAPSSGSGSSGHSQHAYANVPSVYAPVHHPSFQKCASGMGAWNVSGQLEALPLPSGESPRGRWFLSVLTGYIYCVIGSKLVFQVNKFHSPFSQVPGAVFFRQLCQLPAALLQDKPNDMCRPTACIKLSRDQLGGFNHSHWKSCVCIRVSKAALAGFHMGYLHVND